MGDWLGTGNVAARDRQYRPFSQARSFVRTLRLQIVAEWRRYCKGQIPGMDGKPGDIPAAPYRTYEKEWISFADWLGTGNISYWRRELRPFDEAREFARGLGFKKGNEWRQFCEGEIPEKGTKPDDIPATPDKAYKDKGWVGMGDWLGTGNVAAANMTFRSFEDARSFVRGLNLRSQKEWSAYCKGQLSEKGTKPADIPAVPARVYKDEGWAGFGDWLGTGRIATLNVRYGLFHGGSIEARKCRYWPFRNQ